MNWEFGVSRHKLLHLEWINKVLPYIIRNYVQTPGVEHDGKKEKKMYIICVYMYIYICVCVCVCIYICIYVTLLYSKNWHYIINQLYFN